jgi:hypothetical protein
MDACSYVLLSLKFYPGNFNSLFLVFYIHLAFLLHSLVISMAETGEAA